MPHIEKAKAHNLSFIENQKNIENINNYYLSKSHQSDEKDKSKSYNEKNILAIIDSKLINYYHDHSEMRYLLQDNASQTLYNCYIPLTLISRVEQESHEKQLAQKSVLEKGTQEKIKEYDILYQQDFPIELSRLWERDSYIKADEWAKKGNLSKYLPPQRLIIQGAAGMGKTTMLRCVAAHWGIKSKGSADPRMDLSPWCEHFDLLLYLPLRELLAYDPATKLHKKAKNSKIYSQHNENSFLVEWFGRVYQSYLKAEETDHLAECLGALSSSNNKNRVLLLLDGLDEVSILFEDFIPLQKMEVKKR